MSNPLFPLNEYVPDGEPHVFGDRVYLYGSHDAENGDRFCMRDYTVYSAPITDLTDWTCHGVSYRKDQDPRSKGNKLVDYYAPDCVQGNDGRFYLYYSAMGPNVPAFGPMSVAVSDKPEGPFEYLSDIKYADGSPVLKYLTNDPAVINDNGKIYLYYGWGLGRDFRNKLLAPLYNFVQSKLFCRSIAEIKATKPSVMSCAVAELCEDMCTVKGEPKAVLDSKTTADKRSDLYNHAFYEAASIRKFNDLYYLVYSSGENCELAYATSRYPDHGFEYRGIIISNADLGYKGNKTYHMSASTIHGGIEFIGGEYYIFYHRCTNNTDFSRQACAERIHIDESGFISQVEITTQGVEKEALPARRRWKAAECCNLYNKRTTKVMGSGHNHDIPTIVSENGVSYITAVDDGTVVGYKYLRFENVSGIRVKYRGSVGALLVSTISPDSAELRIDLDECGEWKEKEVVCSFSGNNLPLYFTYKGSGQIELLEFEFI